MSRDQKPGKIKLVTTGPIHHPHHERFEDDQADSAEFEAAAANGEVASGGSAVHSILFLIACAIGGAGAVLVTGMIR